MSDDLSWNWHSQVFHRMIHNLNLPSLYPIHKFWFVKPKLLLKRTSSMSAGLSLIFLLKNGWNGTLFLAQLKLSREKFDLVGYEPNGIEIQNKCLIKNQLKASDLMISQWFDWALYCFYLINRGNVIWRWNQFDITVEIWRVKAQCFLLHSQKQPPSSLVPGWKNKAWCPLSPQYDNKNRSN